VCGVGVVVSAVVCDIRTLCSASPLGIFLLDKWKEWVYTTLVANGAADTLVTFFPVRERLRGDSEEVMRFRIVHRKQDLKSVLSPVNGSISTTH
jgi:hypothetical protein